MSKEKKATKEFILDEQLIQPEPEQKGSRRTLQIPRALEERQEDKRLSAIFDDNYWDGI